MVGCLLPQYNSHSNILFFSAANYIEHEIGEEENDNIGNKKGRGMYIAFYKVFAGTQDFVFSTCLKGCDTIYVYIFVTLSRGRRPECDLSEPGVSANVPHRRRGEAQNHLQQQRHRNF